MSLVEVEARHRRITILRLLSEQPDNASTASVLQTALVHVANLMADRDQVLEDIAYLKEQGAVETEDLGVVCAVALTDRGRLAVEGRITIPGVHRPLRR